MKNKKIRLLGVGTIEANGIKVKMKKWVCSEAQFKKIMAWIAQKRYPNTKIHLINMEIRDITHFNEKEVEMYEKILMT